MKHLLFFLAFSFLAVQYLGAAAFKKDLPIYTSSSPECDTIVYSSGARVVGTIAEHSEEEYELSYCDKDRVVLIKKNSVQEIRYASGKVVDVQQLLLEEKAREIQEKKYNGKRRKKLIRKGLIAMGIGVLAALPFGYLGVILSFGGANALATIAILIPISIFLVGAVTLIKGLLIRKEKD